MIMVIYSRYALCGLLDLIYRVVSRCNVKSLRVRANVLKGIMRFSREKFMRFVRLFSVVGWS